MKILFYDRMQDSDANDKLKSAPLADRLVDSSFVITFDASETIDCIGVGYTDATTITINGEVVSLVGDGKYKSGLYILVTEITGTTLTVSHNGTYIGRLAAGQYVSLGLAPAREPGFWNTSKPRKTLSGQIIEGKGGVVGRYQQVDIRYKIDKTAFAQIENGYNNEVGRGYPMFMLFDNEYNDGNGRFVWERFYATADLAPIFQSSVNKFLYSKKIKFLEAY